MTAIMVVSVFALTASAATAGNKIRAYEVELENAGTTTEEVSTDTDIASYIAAKKAAFESQYNPLKTPEYDYGEEHITVPNIDSLFTENSYAQIVEIAENTKYDASDDLIAIGDLINWDNLQVDQGSITKIDGFTVIYKIVTVNKKVVSSAKTATSVKSPQTADNSSFAMWILLLTVSALGIISTVVYKKNRR